MNKTIFWLFGAVLFTHLSCEINKQEAKRETNLATKVENLIPYTVKMTYLHDEEAYTQGLVFYKGRLFESTGSKDSWIAEVNLDKGEQDKKVRLDKDYFGEGITALNDKVYQLTWKHNKGFIYDIESFKTLGTFAYDFEGWGITTDGEHLIISDGTEKIYYLDTLNFEPVKTLQIQENNTPVTKLNELEYIDGYIFANQYETNYLLKIDPETEQVVGKVDLGPLANEIKRKYSNANVLNGIAYRPETKDLLITGKLWPKAYLIKLGE